jgi:hypothetical protein
MDLLSSASSCDGQVDRRSGLRWTRHCCGTPAADPRTINFVSCNRALKLLTAVAVVAVAVSPVATADSGSPSYNQGKQAVDNLASVRHVQFPADTDWQAYCEQVRTNVLRTGQVLQIDSTADFIAGCQDEGRALTGSK